MRVDLDAKVWTHDGEELGSVERAVFDPEKKDVTHFVISTGGLFGRDVLIPRDEIERARVDGNAIRIELTKAEVEHLDTYVPESYVVPPPNWIPPAAYGYGMAGYVWPATYGYVPANTEPWAVGEPEHPSIGKDAVVVDSHGDDIGVVDDVRFDEQTGRLTGFVLRIGGVLRTLFGGGDTVEVNRGMIDRVADSIVYLRVGKDEIERLAK